MNLDRKNITKIILLIVFGVGLFVALNNLSSIVEAFTWFVKMIAPFTIGLCLAFIINVPMKGIENGLEKIKVIEKLNKPKLVRVVSIILTLILVFGFIVTVLFIVIPEFIRTLTSLAEKIPGFFNRFVQVLDMLEQNYPQIFNYINNLNLNWDEFNASLVTWLQGTAIKLASSTFTTATAAVNAVFNFIIGIIFACYVLIQKEKLGRQIKRTMYAVMPEQKTNKILRILSMSEYTFSRFLSGQCIEACLLGTMVLIILSILRYPYTFTISVLIGFTSLIPIFGAIIGCVLGAFILLVNDPMMAVWFVVIILIVQQIEGNFIYPHVVGNSVGLPSIWVLVAVTLGGNLMGIFGMLTFVPISSILYTLLREFVNSRLEGIKNKNE